MRTYRNYTNEDIITAVKNSYSTAEVLRKLGLKDSGGSHSHILKKIKLLKLDTNHWTFQFWNRGKLLKPIEKYVKKEGVKKHLLNKRGNKCECCGLTKWLDKDIILEVHHIDGHRKHNNLDNLKLLCPNCHSFTPNWRGRNRNNPIYHS